MIKLMIVEDEDILREGISCVGDWEQCGIEICGLAANGLQALELINKNKPDIVITDVVMPVMDGIELTKRIYEGFPEIKVIMLSGHEEFQFVKSAMEYRAYSYLLKPARIEKIVEVVTSVKEEILSERRLQEEEQYMRERIKESLPVLREHYLNRLAAEVIENEDEIKRQLDYLEIKLNNENLAVMVCEIDCDCHEKENPLALKVFNLQLSEICNRIIGNEYVCCVFCDLNERVVIVLNHQEGMPAKDIILYLTGKAVRIQNEMKQCNGRGVSVGIGRIIPDFHAFGKAYKEACTALGYKFFMGNCSVIYIGDIEQQEEEDICYAEQIEGDILKCVKVGDIEGVKLLVERYFHQFEERKMRSQNFVYEEIIIFISNVIRSIRSKDESEEPELLLKEIQELLVDVRKNKYPTLKELQFQVKEILFKLTEDINKARLLRSRDLIYKAKEYVQSHLSQDVSLITVADAIYISPNYLSFLFKEAGENFKDYVVRSKMQKAEEMMESGKYNLNQIAHAIGYKDGRYFSQVFNRFKEKG